MADHALLPVLVLTYAVALVFIVLLARLRIPSIIALMAAGVVAGPSGIGIVRTQEEVNLFAEIGIVLLLFAVGLDFSLAEIRRIWKPVIGGGVIQIAGTASVVALALGSMSWRVGVFIGVFVALSSTAIVLNELSARNQLDAPHGRLMVGVLLFQDLAIVALLLLVPMLSGRMPLSSVPFALGRALMAIGLVALLSRLVLPPLLGIVARSGRQEAFPLAVVLASVGTAWVSSLLGVSMELGAFLGGLVLAESEFSHQAFAEVRPLRDVLAGLFFISLGMLVDVGMLATQLPIVLGVTTLVVLVKAAIAAGALMAVATPLRVAVTAGIGLAQVGEFSFILGRSGLELGLLSQSTWQVLLASSIGTMLLTPVLIATAPRVGARLARASPRSAAPTSIAQAGAMSDHVIILGFGVGGRLLARALGNIGVAYVILDLNGGTVRQARREGEPIFFGDATNADALRSAGIERARALTVVLSDPIASSRVVRTTRLLAPNVPVIVRTRYRAEAEALLGQGANVAVAEELEASLEVLAQLLTRLHVPDNAAAVLLEEFRRETVRPLRARTRPLDALPPEISQAPIATHRLHADDWATGRTIAEVDLRARSGALIIAVQQDSRYVSSPQADLRLGRGDVLYLMGDEADVLLARQRLQSGE